MKKRTGKLLTAALALALLLGLWGAPAYAVGVSVSGKTVKPGDSVSVRVSFSGADIFGVRASFSYDSSVLQFTGGSGGVANGNIVLYGGDKSVNSLSCTLNFKAIAAGSGKVSVSCSESYNRDLASLGGGSGGATVTVAVPAAPATPKPTVPVEKREIPVELGGQTWYLWHNIPDAQTVEGFERIQGAWKGESVELLRQPQTGVVLVFLTDQAGKNGALMVCSEDGTLSAYVPLQISGQYVILNPGTAQVPEGYTPAELTLGGVSVAAWQAAGDDSGYFLVWATDAAGQSGWYCYDPAQGTLQRYAKQVIIVEVTPAPTAAPAPTPAPTPTPTPALGQRLAGDAQAMTLILLLLAAVGVLAAALVILCVKTGSKGKDAPAQDTAKETAVEETQAPEGADAPAAQEAPAAPEANDEKS
ncbi:MAG: cohesin domain-containing protein [Eubacteriales bacterium]|nr:cohesin domain-containing protein [Eubacteriales bacterium]